MPVSVRRLIVATGALAITAAVFAFFFWLVTLLPQAQPNVVMTTIYPSARADKP